MMIANASSPSINGIFTSSVKTSGFSCFTFSTVSRPLLAVPATSKSACLLNRSVSTFRMNAESSAIKTRIIRLILSRRHPFTVDLDF